MWDTIANFIKDWGAMSPSRKLTTLLMTLLFCAFMAMSYLYKQAVTESKRRDEIRNVELNQCREDNKLLQQDINGLQSEFRRYLIYEKQFKQGIKDSLDGNN